MRAYDRRDQEVIWKDDFVGGSLNFVTGMVLHQERLIVSGFGGPGSFVKVYDARTGVVLWEETPFESGLGLLNQSLTVTRDSVVIGGSRTVEFVRRFSVRSLDLDTGQLQWEDIEEGSDSALAVVARNGLVIAAGEVAGPGGTFVPFVRAYDR